MLLPVRFLWDQLNGPQIRGICDAMLSFLKMNFDDKLEYLNKFTIDSVNDDHLTLMGILTGFARPVVTEPDQDYFIFSEDPEHDTTHGFSSLEDRAVGGKFTADEGEGKRPVAMAAAYYRALLRAFIKGEGELGSLKLLDDICYELTYLDSPGAGPSYQFSFEHTSQQLRAPGDIYIDMGEMEDWRNPLQIYAVLRGLSTSVYAPQPQIFVSLDIGGDNE